MPTLWVTGDSFSNVNLEDINENAWSVNLSKQLKYSLANESLPGCNQDWCWRVIKKYQHEITQEDQIVIALTDYSRFWFYKEHPNITNSFIVDFEERINDPSKTKAAEYYIKYIQRDDLDAQFQEHRLGWLNNLVRIKGWKKPIILQAFESGIETDQFPDLIFSKGCLSDISKAEEVGNIEQRGIDVRYNHMCISNHKILVQKIMDTITSNSILDLTHGFNKQCFSKATLNQSAEISPLHLKQYNSIVDTTPLNWRKRFLD